MNELKVTNFNGVEVVDSRDVARMVERDHAELLKSIRTYCEYLDEGEIPAVDFFIEDEYIGGNGQKRPSYLITKMGCDMIANKTTGKKGVLFTAAYVAAFNQMHKRLVDGPRIAPGVSPSGLARLISVTRRVMLDMGCTAMDVGQMAQSVFHTWNVPSPEYLNKQIPGQFSLWEPQRPAIEET